MSLDTIRPHTVPSKTVYGRIVYYAHNLPCAHCDYPAQWIIHDRNKVAIRHSKPRDSYSFDCTFTTS